MSVNSAASIACVLVMGVISSFPLYGQIAGWISSSHPQKCYTIDRDDAAIDLLLLEEDDEITIPEDCTVYFRTSEAVVKLQNDDSPYEVPAIEPSRFLGRFLEFIGVHKFFRKIEVDSMAIGPMRGDLRAVMLTSTDQVFVHDGRPLQISVDTGVPPFELVIRRLDDTVCRVTTESFVLVCDSIDQTGYLVGELRDAKGGELAFSVAVIASDHAARHCAAAFRMQEGSNEEPILADYMSAMALAQCGEEWRLEAYQLLAPYLSEDSMARAIYDYVRQGGFSAASQRPEVR